MTKFGSKKDQTEKQNQILQGFKKKKSLKKIAGNIPKFNS